MIDKFIEALQTRIPSIKLGYKDESILMFVLGKILFFNPSFMTDYITTVGNTVYFPSREYIENKKITANIIMAHEFVHVCDANKIGVVWFSILYLMPQIFILLFIPLLFVIGLWALLFLLFILPLPAYFRMKFELRGYTMSLFATNEYLLHNFSEDDRRNKLLALADDINKTYFKGFAYYLMWPFGVNFDKTIENILSGDILKSDEVYNFIRQSLPR